MSRDVVDFFGERILYGEVPGVGFARADPSRWRAERAAARRLLPYVKFGLDSLGRAFFWGFLSVRSRHGSEHGPFTIRVIYPPHFPDAGVVPSVYLMSHRDRWRNGHDSHIEPDWRLCLFVPGESGIDFRRPDSLAELLATVVIFLRKEIIYQRALEREHSGGPIAVWPGEDRAHGRAGLAQAVRARGGIRPEEPCICGSGSPFGDCCRRRIGSRADVEEKKTFDFARTGRQTPADRGVPRRRLGRRRR